MEPAPPSYTSVDEQHQSADAPPGPQGTSTPPAYLIPKAFPIGVGRVTKPLLDVSQIKDHLALLDAFAQLKLSVESMSADPEIPYLPSGKELRWAWFVGLAVERFERWCKGLKPSHSENGLATILPPIDVLMVWHAYLLNPGWYAEDGERIDALKGLHQAGKELSAALGRGFGELFVMEPSQQRVDNWTQITLTPFDPFTSARQIVTREIVCPKCRATTDAPYMTKSSTGYLQQKFSMKCGRSQCAFQITRDTLALRKFTNDLAKYVRGKTASELLAGTVHTPVNPLDLARGRIIKAKMLSSSHLRRPVGSKPGTVISDAAYAQHLMEREKYSLDKLKTTLASKMKKQGGKLIGRVMSAYLDDKIFSVELIGAVLRQGSFVKKMHDLQWTKAGFFDNADDVISLHHAIARYHAFFDLIASSPASFFVPTLDIDLAWHTHQLMASKYSQDTIKLVGRFIDHDDKVEESHLASSFDSTCRAWKKRFGVQYAHCGCPLPSDSLWQRTVGRPPPYLIPPNHADLLAATHPSDHNAVFALHRRAASEAAQQRRLEELAKRERQRTRDLAAAGKLGGRRRVKHDPAFLVAVPMHYTPGVFAGSANIIDGGAGIGGCAAVGARCIVLWLPTDIVGLGRRHMWCGGIYVRKWGWLW
ncbi:hypothetical protein DFH06DRAFT_1073106 [Mycena polygramma]|nr:hypothetical protein DFH06DRAFT_1073106 [Mycena polygramma]